MPGDCVVRQPAHALVIAPRREILEGADPQVTVGDAGQDGARQGLVAKNVFAAGDYRQGAGGGDAQRMQGFAHQNFTQHRAECRLAIAIAGKRRAAGTLKGDVAAPAVAINDLADQQGPSVTELGREVAELVSGIDLCDGIGARR